MMLLSNCFVWALGIWHLGVWALGSGCSYWFSGAPMALGTEGVSLKREVGNDPIHFKCSNLFGVYSSVRRIFGHFCDDGPRVTRRRLLFCWLFTGCPKTKTNRGSLEENSGSSTSSENEHKSFPLTNCFQVFIARLAPGSSGIVST